LGPTAAYFFTRWRVYVLSFVGVAFQAMLGYGTLQFIVALMERAWEIKRGQASLVVGLVLLVFGVGGMLLAGAVTDRWVAKGLPDAHFRMLLIGVIGVSVFPLLFPLMPNAPLGVPLLCGAMFFSNMIWGTAYAAVIAVSPNEVRGQATAVYLFVINL